MFITDAARQLMQHFKSTPPELHACKHCGAGLTRLWLVSGGIVRIWGRSSVRMEIGCRDCHRTHKFKGTGVRAHWLAMQLANQTSRRNRDGSKMLSGVHDRVRGIGQTL